MLKIGVKGNKILKFFHVTLSSFWGGALFFVFIGLTQCKNHNSDVIHGVLLGLQTLEFIAKPCMLGLIITGLIYSIFTGWGFKKFYWIVIKWVITLCLPFVASRVFDSSLEKIIELSSATNFLAESLEFTTALLNAQIAFGIGSLIFVFILFISVYKPFGRIGQKIKADN